jgi:anti-anti-sigma regulatory factor
MPYSIANSQGIQILKLEGAVTMRHAREVAAKLSEVLDVGTPLGVDTASLQDIDTGMLQLLCSLATTVPAIFFDKPSNAFVRAVERCGLRRELLGSREGL